MKQSQRETAPDNHQWRSPFRALLWKEWRESWWLLVLVIAVAVACSVIRFTSPGKTPIVLVQLLSVGVVALGARLFSSETARGTAVFQGERPVSKGAIWNAKVLLPLCVIIAGTALFVLVDSSCGFPHAKPRSASEIRLVALFARPATRAFYVLAVGTMAFACSTICGVLLDRPITALAAGFISAFGVGLCNVALFVALGWKDPGLLHQALISAIIFAEALILLLLSRIIYTRR